MSINSLPSTVYLGGGPKSNIVANVRASDASW